MLVMAVVGLALADGPAGIDAADTPAPTAPEVAEGAPEYALSVGTGPRPLNSLSLGLTGMGARFLVPADEIFPWFGMAYHSFTLTEVDDDDRWVSHASTWTVSAGVRGVLGRGARYDGVDPYATLGVFANRVGLRSGEPGDDDWDRTNGLTFGSAAAFGLEGYLTRHLSVGLEVGATAGYFTGGEEGDDASRALVVTSLSAAQLTVWR